MSPGGPGQLLCTSGPATGPAPPASLPADTAGQARAHVRVLPFIRSPAVIGAVTSTPPAERVSWSHLRAGVRGGARPGRPRTARASWPRPPGRRPPGAAPPPAPPARSHSTSLKVAAGSGSASAPGPDPEPEAGHRKRAVAPCSLQSRSAVSRSLRFSGCSLRPGAASAFNQKCASELSSHSGQSVEKSGSGPC